MGECEMEQAVWNEMGHEFETLDQSLGSNSRMSGGEESTSAGFAVHLLTNYMMQVKFDRANAVSAAQLLVCS